MNQETNYGFKEFMSDVVGPDCQPKIVRLVLGLASAFAGLVLLLGISIAIHNTIVG